jgi:phage-related protein
MPQALPLPDKIAQGSAKVNVVPRIITAEFGDGYSQRAADGINNLPETVEVRWIPVLKTDKDTIVNALNATGGWDYLTWTPPAESTAKKYVMTPEGYSVELISGKYYVVSVMLRQVYDV